SYFSGGAPRLFRKAAWLWAAIFAAIVLPFVAANPAEFYRGTFDWYVVSSANSWRELASSNAHNVGITGVLYYLGALRFSVVVQLAGLAGIGLLAWRRARNQQAFLSVACGALLWFLMTTLVTYQYLYFVFLLVFSVVELERCNSALLRQAIDQQEHTRAA